MKRIAEAKLTQLFTTGLSLRLHLRTDLHLLRKLWHMVMGFAIVSVYLATDMSRSTGVVILGSILGLDLLIEGARLRIPTFNETVLRFWGPIMRHTEVNRFSGVPYYLAACILAIGIFPKVIAVLAILYLAFGDPMASLFGILYGKRIPGVFNGKSYIGTAASVITCALITFVFLNLAHPSHAELLTLTVIGGIAGGTAELLPLEVDDNFAIPIVSGFALWLSFILLGV